MKAVPHRVDRIRSRSRASVLRTGFALNCFGAPCRPILLSLPKGCPFSLLLIWSTVSSFLSIPSLLLRAFRRWDSGTLSMYSAASASVIICSSSHPTRPPICLGLGSVCTLSHVQLFATQWTLAHQAPLPMEFSRQEYWSG